MDEKRKQAEKDAHRDRKTFWAICQNTTTFGKGPTASSAFLNLLTVATMYDEPMKLSTCRIYEGSLHDPHFGIHNFSMEWTPEMGCRRMEGVPLREKVGDAIEMTRRALVNLAGLLKESGQMEAASKMAAAAKAVEYIDGDDQVYDEWLWAEDDNNPGWVELNG